MMKLRWKLIKPLGFFILAALTALGIGLNYGLSSYLLALEVSEHRERLDIVENMVTSSMLSLEAWAFDMAHWDETVAFLNGKNKKYLSSNFPPSVFESLTDWNSSAIVKPEAVAFADQQGEIVEFVSYDEKTGERRASAPGNLTPYLKAIIEKLSASPDLDSDLSFVEFNKDFYQLATIQVKDSQGQSRMPFYFIVMRKWSSSELNSVQKLTGLHVEIVPSAESEAANDIVTGDSTIKGFIPYFDPIGKKLFQVAVSAERTTFKLGQKGSRLLVGLILAFSVFMVLAMLWIFEALVIHRIHRLNTTVQRSKNESDEIERIIDRGEDEISQLSVDLHSLLKHLKDTSELDPLTGLGNRRSFYNKVSKLIYEIEVLKSSTQGYFSVLQFDIDKFKSINDNYGHPQGDEVIKALAHIIGSFKHRNICAARFGGEEFVIFMYSLNESDPEHLAENIRHNLQSHKIPLLATPHETISVTTSAGVFTAAINSKPSIEEMLELSDKALYHSKKNGRNLVSSYKNLKLAS